MKDNFEPFTDFFHKYDAYEKETVDDIINRYSSTESELHHTISSLMESRYKQRDGELEVLDIKIKKLLKQLQGIHIQRMLEELQCFKDVLALQKRLFNKNDASNN
jgi:hypothetical protein